MRYPYKEALKIAEEIVMWLKPYCERIQIAGSLRRKKADVGDIEILCIPKPLLIPMKEYTDNLDFEIRCLIDEEKKLDYRLNIKGSRVYGKQNKLLVHCASGIPLDVFSTTEENWATALVVRTGPKESNIRICMAAKNRRLRFHAYGAGFTKRVGSTIVCLTCHSEKEVFEAVGLPYLPPEER